MSVNSSLLLGLLDLAPELQQAFGEAWPEVRDELLLLAGRLENEGDTAPFRRDLDRLLDRLLTTLSPATRDKIRGLIGQARDDAGLSPTLRAPGGARPGETKPAREPKTAAGGAVPPATGAIVVPVFFGTDRAVTTDPACRYGGIRGELGYGIAEVSVPTDPKVRDVGELSGPKWWRLEFRPDTKKHVVLLDVGPLPRDPFVAALRDALLSADQRDALLFVHGYNVGFVDAARRAAQIGVDLKFAGRTLLYSWCSAGDAHKYTVDEATIEWSTPHFEALLRLALTEIGAHSVHVIAHSMGNRALVRALERFDADALPPGAARLRQIIFAAPDVDGDTFRRIASAFRQRAERFTLYASATDVALRASRLVHGYPRAGDAGDALVVVDGVDTIDATMADTSLIGLRHSYFGTKRSILNDIFALIQHGLAPGERFDVEAASSPRGAYWLYRP